MILLSSNTDNTDDITDNTEDITVSNTDRIMLQAGLERRW